MADKTIALYMRLSDEDDDKAKTDESNSISHQRKLMMDYGLLMMKICVAYLNCLDMIWNVRLIRK